MPDFDAFSLLDIKKRNKRSHGKRKNDNFKRKHKTVLSLFDLNILLNSGRHQMLSKLTSLSFSSLRKLEDEANKYYDRKHYLYEAALLTRCYTQHALRPYIDSEINNIRHVIKIPFINKGIEFIDLPSIFRDNNVISAIPSFFENTESPIICYKYNKPIRNTILNFNKLVSDLDIETSSPDSWDCKVSMGPRLLFPICGVIFVSKAFLFTFIKPENNNMKELIHQYNYSQISKEPTNYCENASLLLDLF